MLFVKSDSIVAIGITNDAFSLQPIAESKAAEGSLLLNRCDFVGTITDSE